MESERLTGSYSASVSGQKTTGSKTVSTSSSSSSSHSSSSSSGSHSSSSSSGIHGSSSSGGVHGSSSSSGIHGSSSSGGEGGSAHGSGSVSKTTSYRLSGSGSGNAIPDNSGKTTSTSSWNRTSTVTRYRPDGTIESSVSTHSGGPGPIGGTDFGDVLDEEYDDYEEEIEETQPLTQTHHRRVRQIPEMVHDRLAANKIRIRSRRQSNRAKELDTALDCGATQCTIIKCSAGPITSNNRVVFKLRARIWAQTISEVKFILSTSFDLLII